MAGLALTTPPGRTSRAALSKGSNKKPFKKTTEATIARIILSTTS